MYADGLSFMISQFVYSGDDSLQSISLLGAMAPLDVVSVKLGLKTQKLKTLQSVPIVYPTFTP